MRIRSSSNSVITMHKSFNYLQMLALGSIASLMMIAPLHADDGKLMEAYPPNVVAENFKLSDLGGELHELVDFRGKHVVVNFWSMFVDFYGFLVDVEGF